MSNASITRRLGAFIYDLLVLFAVLLLISAIAVSLNHGEALTGHSFFLCTATVIYLFFCWFWIHGGQTLGMRAWHISIVDEQGKFLTWRSASWRFLLALLACCSLGLSHIWMFFNSDKLALHDIWSKSRVIFLKQRTVSETSDT